MGSVLAAMANQPAKSRSVLLLCSAKAGARRLDTSATDPRFEGGNVNRSPFSTNEVPRLIFINSLSGGARQGDTHMSWKKGKGKIVDGKGVDDSSAIDILDSVGRVVQSQVFIDAVCRTMVAATCEDPSST
jgi:hypothetical protein